MLKAVGSSGLAAPRPDLAINDLVTVQMGPHTYPSRVEDLTPDTITLVMPLSQGQLVIPPLGRPVCLRYSSLDHGLVLIDTTVLEHLFQEVPRFVVGRINRFQLVQQRQYYRLTVALQTVLWADPGTDVGDSPVIGQTRDISGGGMRFVAPVALEGEVSFVLHLPGCEGDPILGHGRILEVLRWGSLPRSPFEQRMQFTRLERGAQDRLIRYIFRKQREWRQRYLA